MGMRRTVLLLSSVALAMILVVWGGFRAEVTQPAQAQADSRPNIIFVMTDDQDKDTIRNMPFVRDELTPNATTFPNATFNYPLCCPSRSSILRGQYTHNHGVWENTVALDGGYEKFLENDLDSSIFPMWLDSSGYQTAGFGLYVNGWSPSQHGKPEGFDFFRAYNQDWSGVGVPDTEHRDSYVKDNAVRWLAQNVSGPPLMMWVSFHAPHSPFRYDPRYEGRFKDVRMPKGAAFNEADVSDKPEYVQNLPRLTEAQVAQKEKNHRDRLRALLTPDTALRELRDTVREAGELDNTYIVFWTDNGWMMGEHRLGAKRHAYVESVSFPMMVRGPGVPKGETDTRVVMNQDLAPTFAELANAPTPDFVDGRSMVPILDGEGPWRDVGLIQASPPYNSTQPPAYQGLRAEDFTYVEYVTGEREYYNLRTDPNQLENGYRALTDKRKADLAAMLDGLKGCAGSVCREAEDVTPPETSILRTGTGAVFLTNSTDASFTFESDEPGSEFECSLNSGTAFGSCTSPETYSDLTANRQHTFRVRAIDRTGRVDPTPDSHTWTIDTEEPDTRITGGPSGPTNDDTPTFAFSASDNLAATADLRYSFRVDGGTWSPFSGGMIATVGGSTGLGEGDHTFYVKARDRAGNVDSSPDQRAFTVDTTEPASPLIDAPQNNEHVTADFRVSGTAEAGSVVELFEGASSRGTDTADASGDWSVSLSGVAEGSHTYTARATDAARNTSETSNARTVIVDITAPTVQSVVPAENATGIDPAANVEVTFSEAMKRSTVNGSTIKLYRTRSTTPIAAQVTYDVDAEKATLDPVDPLVLGKHYKAVVSSRTRDEAGNRLDQDSTRAGLQEKAWFFRVSTSTSEG
jgi:arylsulfatase A-like enzyme